MPADLYTCQVSYDHAIRTPAPAVLPLGSGFFSDGIVFAVTEVGLNHPSWAIIAGLGVGDNGTGVNEFFSRYELLWRLPDPLTGTSQQNPFFWVSFNTPAVLRDAPGSVGATYLAGGTLKIAKDYLANTITMTCPLGSVTRTLDENDYPNGLTGQVVTGRLTTELIPYAIGMAITLPSPAAATQERAQFYNLQADLNAAVYFFNALSAADPGFWFDPPLGSPGDAFGTTALFDHFTGTQLLTRFQIDDTYTLLTDPANGSHNYVRLLDGGSYTAPGVDMDYSKEHGVVFRASVMPMDVTDVILQRSFDNGHSWEGFTVSSDMAANVSSPTVTWFNQKLYVTWQDGTAVKEARSLDGGRTWGMPTTLPFAGTNPRRVIHRQGGGAFYFVFQSGGLQCYFSYDNNATFDGPFLVVASPPAVAQQIDAEFVPNGSLLVSIFIAGVLNQYRSTDLGRTWV